MFGFKQNSLIDALYVIQRFQQESDLQEAMLRPDQMSFIGSLMTFKEIDKHFKAEGLSNFGGLAKFALNALEKTIGNIKAGTPPPLMVIDFVEKISHAVFALKHCLAAEATASDIHVIELANEKAMVWFDLPERVSLLNELGLLVEEMNAAPRSETMLNRYITRMAETQSVGA